MYSLYQKIKMRYTRHRSAVIREQAHTYMLMYLVSFAGSVILTRLFLELTGYPQIGNSVLHIAHVLWGGLFLFVASLIPLLFANRWAYPLAAILSGIGIGLFMDEVGKFITRNNDYFYPAAAPIIYALFLLTVWIFTRIRRHPRNDARHEMYAVLDALQEIPDRDFEPAEREVLLARLRRIQELQEPDLANMAGHIALLVESDRLPLSAQRRSRFTGWYTGLRGWVDTHLSYQRLKWLLILGILVMFTLAIAELVGLVQMMNLYQVSLRMIAQNDLSILGSKTAIHALWYLTHVILQTVLAFLALISLILILIRRVRNGVDLAIAVSVVSLTIMDLLAFYVNQFTATIDALIHLILMLGLLYFRSRFLKPAQIQ